MSKLYQQADIVRKIEDQCQQAMKLLSYCSSCIIIGCLLFSLLHLFLMVLYVASTDKITDDLLSDYVKLQGDVAVYYSLLTGGLLSGLVN